jgi:hypothetical protein
MSQSIGKVLNALLDNSITKQQAIMRLQRQRSKVVERETDEIKRAFGGCEKCYGKGYATVNERWSGIDTDTDIGSKGGVVSGGNPFTMKFCTCGRGHQLHDLIEQL